MASLIEGLMSQLGGTDLGGLSRQLGVDEGKAQNGLAAALPVLLGALSRNSQSSSGATQLGAALDRDHDGSILKDVSGFLQQGDTSTGNGILKHVLGGKQVRVEKSLAKSSGMSNESAGKMLALLAPLVLGALGQAKRQGNMDASQLAGVLGQERQAVEQRAPQQMNALNMLLDSDGDGDVDLSDIVTKGSGILGKLFGRG